MLEWPGGWLPNGLCSLFLCDIASFGHPARSDLDRTAVRTALYDGLRRSFDEEGIPFWGCYQEDRGDGVLVAVPPQVDTAVLLTSLVERLRAEVRRHNTVSAATSQMRLRLAVHTGVVRSDGKGLVGTAVNHAFRLLDADELRQALRESGADLALIASQRVYDDVIRQGLGLVDPDEYRPVVAAVKETTAPAWIRVPGMRPPVERAPIRALDTRIAPAAELTVPDPPVLPPAGSADHAAILDSLVRQALTIRQLRGRHLRTQIVGELPLALANVINTHRTDDDKADMWAIVAACYEHPSGLPELLRVIRQFVGDSVQVDALGRLVDAVERARNGGSPSP
jgi:hypothetical protein